MENHCRTHALGDLIDGVLERSARADLLRHLDGCAACRLELEAIVALRASARALPRGIQPPRDLWAGIAARIEGAEAAPGVLELSTRRTDARIRRGWIGLAAAALLLIVLSSGATMLLMRARDAAPVALEPASRVGSGLAFASFRPAEREYLETVQVLEAELAARRGSLAPETVATIEENLLIIDRAIEETRAALRADPGTAELPLLLSDAYRKKVELLQTAIRLST